jgi:hypothetical protein
MSDVVKTEHEIRREERERCAKIAHAYADKLVDEGALTAAMLVRKLAAKIRRNTGDK